MKLIFCPSCQDLVKLQRSKRTCHCGKSWGEYTDHIKAQIGGLSIAVGIDNKTFAGAVRERNQSTGPLSAFEFEAFIFGRNPKNIVKEDT